MAEIINLRMARKAKKRADAAQQAAENRAKFGRTKERKQQERMEAERTARTIESARREGPAVKDPPREDD